MEKIGISISFSIIIAIVFVVLWGMVSNAFGSEIAALPPMITNTTTANITNTNTENQTLTRLNNSIQAMFSDTDNEDNAQSIAAILQSVVGLHGGITVGHEESENGIIIIIKPFGNTETEDVEEQPEEVEEETTEDDSSDDQSGSGSEGDNSSEEPVPAPPQEEPSPPSETPGLPGPPLFDEGDGGQSNPTPEPPQIEPITIQICPPLCGNEKEETPIPPSPEPWDRCWDIGAGKPIQDCE